MADAYATQHRETLLAGALRAVERSPELQRMLERKTLKLSAKQKAAVSWHFFCS
jgi:hypothetical protein